MQATERRSDEATKGAEQGAWARSSSLRRFVASSLSRSAFSLTELLVIISIIVLVLALALPTFNLITGARSLDMAYNQINAFIARARNEAIGNQETRGVMFYIDPRTQRVNLALVRQTDPPSSPLSGIDVYLDLVLDADPLALPKGVGVQVIDDRGRPGASAGANAENDRYIGFNTRSAKASSPSAPPSQTDVAYGGVILFSGQGQLISKRYAFKTHEPNATLRSDAYTQMGRLLYIQRVTDPDPAPWNQSDNRPDLVPVDPAVYGAKVLRSAFGFVLFDLDAFLSQAGTSALSDFQVVQPTLSYLDFGSAERTKENWLDQNALPVLINRYNGTLSRGE